MNIFKTVSTLFLATIFISGTAIAEGEKLTDKLSKTAITVDIEINSCNADAAILCPGIVEAAMTLEMGMIAIDYSIKACEADADKHCLNIKAGEGRIVSCLRKNESKLNKECKSALKETGLWDIGAN